MTPGSLLIIKDGRNLVPAVLLVNRGKKLDVILGQETHHRTEQDRAIARGYLSRKALYRGGIPMARNLDG